MIEKLRSMSPADVSEEMKASVAFLLEGIEVEEPGLHAIKELPRDEQVLAALTTRLGDAQAAFWAEAFLDDTIMLELNTAGRPLACSAACLWLHHCMFGWPRPGAPPCVRASKVTGWNSVQHVLGVVLDLNKMEISLPQDKADRLRQLLQEAFPRTRTSATVSELYQLIGYLRCYSYCVRPGRYFLWRLIEPLRGMCDRLHEEVILTAEFHEDLDAWRQIVQQPRLVRNNFASPVHNHVRRPPTLLAISDACGEAGGGVLAPAGLWWQVAWPEDIRARFALTESGSCPPERAITIAHLELASLLLGVVTLVEWAKGKALPLEGEAVLALADNTNAVHWIRKAGARDRKAAALVRALGVEEAAQGFSCLTEYLPGVANVVADFISRHDTEESQSYLSHVLCPLRGVRTDWVQVQPPSRWLERVMRWLRASTVTTP
jgi:hypothetical protein